MADNFIKVDIAPDETVRIIPKEPFKSVYLTQQQTIELIAALQSALDRLRTTEFVRTVDIERWYVPERN